MNTYTVNVNIGTTIQVTISADNEDDAELIASEKAAEIISDSSNLATLQKNIEVIDAEVAYEIKDISLADIAEFKK